MDGPRAMEGGPRGFAWAALALLAATLCWFSPALFFGRTLLSFDERGFAPFVQDADPTLEKRPQNFVTSDLQGWILAREGSAVARLKRGELPLWDPTELLGRPSHADASYPTFYPPHLLHLALPVVQAYAWSMALHVLFAGIGMLLLLRRLALQPVAALVGALAFAFSGWMLVHLHIPHFVRTGSWLPWLVLASIRLADSPRAGRAALFALLLGLAALSGYPTILGVMLFGVAGVAAAAILRAREKGRALAWHAGAAALGLALGAVELLPVAELRSRSVRAQNVSEEAAQRKSLRPAHLVSLAAPDFQGNPVALRQQGFAAVESYPIAREFFSLDVQDNYVENTLYGGVAALLLALVGSCAAPRRAAMLGFLGLFVLGIFVSAHTPLQWLFRDWLVPGLGAGSPKRALLLSAFGLAGLAAAGTEVLLRARRLPAWLFGCFGVALAGTLAAGWIVSAGLVGWWGGGAGDDEVGRVKALLAGAFSLPLVLALACAALAPSFSDSRLARSVGPAGLVLLLLGDLMVFGWRFNPFQSPQARGARTPAIDFLTKPENDGRCARFLDHFLMPASIVSAWGVKSVEGVQALLVREVDELLERWQPGCIDPRNPNHVASFRDPRRFALPILDLLARWLVWGAVGAPPEELGFVTRYVSEKEGLAVSENPRALPAAFFADRARVVEDREERLAALVAPDFAPARVAIVESERDLAGLPRAIRVESSVTPSEPPPRAEVLVSRKDPETFVARVSTPAAGVLVVSEAFAPGWRAEGLESELPAIRVDHALLGFPLPAGSHELRIRYLPPTFALGAAVSLGAAAALLVLALFSQRLRSRPPESAQA